MSKLVENLISYLNNYPIKIGDTPFVYKGLEWQFQHIMQGTSYHFSNKDILYKLKFTNELGRDYIVPISPEEDTALMKAVQDFELREQTLFENQMKDILEIND